jgi:hypothetical protein
MSRYGHRAVIRLTNRAIERLDGVALVPRQTAGRSCRSSGTSIAEFECSCAMRSTATL